MKVMQIKKNIFNTIRTNQIKLSTKNRAGGAALFLLYRLFKAVRYFIYRISSYNIDVLITEVTEVHPEVTD